MNQCDFKGVAEQNWQAVFYAIVMATGMHVYLPKHNIKNEFTYCFDQIICSVM